jgi:predicted O-linked N-acetylglucosamine transferase (SPINDLY family)
MTTALFDQALALHRSKRLGEAERLYRRILAAAPNDFPARCMLGVLRLEQGRPEDAAEELAVAVQMNPRSPLGHANHANALMSLKRYDEAASAYAAALALTPGDEKLLAGHAEAMLSAGRFEELLAGHDAALRAKPEDITLLVLRGNLLHRAQRFADALASFETALRLRPRDPQILLNRGAALVKLFRFEEALQSYDDARALAPNMPEIHYNRANALIAAGHAEEGLAAFDTAIALRPAYVRALHNRGLTLIDFKRFAEGVASLRQSQKLAPDNPDLMGNLAQGAAHANEWSRRETFKDELREDIAASKSKISPFIVMGHFDDPALQLAAARHWNAEGDWAKAPPLPPRAAGAHEKIRLGYLSPDFRSHPVGRLMAGVFEAHDRAQFEVYGLSLAEDDQSPLRARMIAAVDHFHDVRLKNDGEIVELIRDLEIDILIDLGGHTKDARPGVILRRAAPVQVNYLGFAGSFGSAAMDYILLDPIVAPMTLQPHFLERIVHLPVCYMPHDAQRSLPKHTPTRAEHNLPETGFVFCSFASAFKINPEVFDVWMRLLKAIEGSVLWLTDNSQEPTENLRREAAARGVDPARLIFAAPVPGHDDYLARYKLVDLFLDTAPYNAHSTAVDALWMGAPVVTMRGVSFAARVGESLAHAVNMPELVADDLKRYEALALGLALDPAKLEALKQKLAAERTRLPLFDSARVLRGLEAAYQAMWRRRQRGEEPAAFAVAG